MSSFAIVDRYPVRKDDMQFTCDYINFLQSGRGLINDRSTCYVNCVVQVLAHIPPFVMFLTKGSNHLVGEFKFNRWVCGK